MSDPDEALGLTHLDSKGAARMVDVGAKPVTERVARARCVVRMRDSTAALVRNAELGKGDALQVARIAGIMAAKRTSDLIPLCHPLGISGVEIDFDFVPGGLQVDVAVRVSGRTGVEMEALAGAAVAGLTVIDMVKSVERGVWLESVRLLEKSGGRSGRWVRPADG